MVSDPLDDLHKSSTSPQVPSPISEADECRCGGRGVWTEVHWSETAGGKTVVRYCSCDAGVKAAREATESEAERIWENSGVSNRHMGLTLESSPLNLTQRDLMAKIKAELTGDEDHDPWSNSWLFWGDYGVGKTGLAVGIAREMVSWEASSFLFTTLPDLMTELRATYNRKDGPSESDVLQKYAQATILVIDDLGAEQVKDSGWLEDRLYQIIGRRHGSMYSPTIFTSNLSPAELGARIGERNMWRVVEMCESRVYHVTGPNLRQRA